MPRGLLGLIVIIQAFLRWAETARVADRAKAADALGRAFLHTGLGGDERKAATLALTYLLDDPSPSVRQALANALGQSPRAPRAVILALAEDQPRIAATVIAQSPVLSENDLVDLVGRGTDTIRALVAARPDVSPCVAAAIAEVGEAADISILLENRTASVTRYSLRRIAERFGHETDIRNLLLERENLPADARHMLVGHVRQALAASGIVRATLTDNRIGRLSREAAEQASMTIAGAASELEVTALVEYLRASGQLTPALLVHALCIGKADFVASAVASLSGLGEKRTRPILATGRMHAVRALFESTGLSREMSEVLVDAVMLWRKAASSGADQEICMRLLARIRDRNSDSGALAEMANMLDRLQRMQGRMKARDYASEAALAA